MRVAVYGAGISGLAAAHALGRDHEVTVFEARDRAGGPVRTERFADCLVEWGPNGFLDHEPATLQLAEELGLTPRLVRARSDAARRFVWRAGRLRELPHSAKAFLGSDCLPFWSRMRVALEPWLRGRPPDGDESVHQFAVRHLGRGAAATLVDAFVTGVFAGDPSRLSVRSAFPKLAAVQGSLLRAGGFGPGGTLTSFDDGLQVLVDALAARVELKTGHRVASIERGEFDRVVCTLPAAAAAPLLPGELATLLPQIPTAPVAVVAMAIPEPLDVPDAFGFLVPRGEGLRILGTLYDSSIFDNRAPAGTRLFRTLVGGRRDPEAVALDDGALEELVLGDLRRVWGFSPKPAAVRVLRHEPGIAQYELGHAALLARIEAACPDWLTLAGASYRGVALNACIREGLESRA